MNISNTTMQMSRQNLLMHMQNLLVAPMVDGCKLTSLDSQREIGTGENFKGDSLLIGLSLNGVGVTIAIPRINRLDNPSSTVSRDDDAVEINGEYNKSLLVTRNYYQNTGLTWGEEFWASFKSQNIEETTIIRRDQLVVYYNAKQTVTAIFYQAQDKSGKMLIQANCGAEFVTKK